MVGRRGNFSRQESMKTIELGKEEPRGHCPQLSPNLGEPRFRAHTGGLFSSPACTQAECENKPNGRKSMWKTGTLKAASTGAVSQDT